MTRPLTTQGAAVGRRDFLRGAATLGAAALLGGVHTAWARRRPKTRLGLWPGGMDGLSASERRDELEAAIRRSFAVDRARGDCYALDKPLIPDYIRKSVADGRRAYLKLQPWLGSPPDRKAVPWTEIASGTWDKKLRRKAARAAALPGWHLMTFHAEPNVNHAGVQPASGTPAEFAAAFDHVRTVFDDAGATNLVWAVVLTASVYRSGTADQWMPDGYDQIGVDGYNRVATDPDRARSFVQLFEPAVDYAQGLDRRLFVGETGCQEKPGDGAYKAQWIQAVPDALRAWDRVAAVVWNHSNDGDGGWHLDSSRPALRAFREVANLAPFA